MVGEDDILCLGGDPVDAGLCVKVSQNRKCIELEFSG